MISEADCQALLAHLYRALDLLPGVPDSLRNTLRTSCLKKIRLLQQQGALTHSEAAHLKNRVRETTKEVNHD